jgi:hypothetical protein
MAGQKAVAAWIVGAIAVAALAVGYGLGRSGEGAPEGRETAAPATEPRADAGPTAENEGRTTPAALGAEAPPPGPAPSPALRATAPEPRYESAEAAAAGLQAEETAAEDSPSFAGPEPPRVTSVMLPAGTPLRLRLLTPASSQTSAVGDVITAELVEAVHVEDRIVLLAETRLRGRVVEAVPLRRIGGQARLAIAFERAVADLETVEIRADWARTGRSETGKDAATIAAGAAAGTVIGNQAKKNDRGKILGGLIGAGIGAAVATKTPGEAVELPEGALLEVELAVPVRVTVELE